MKMPSSSKILLHFGFIVVLKKSGVQLKREPTEVPKHKEL